MCDKEKFHSSLCFFATLLLSLARSLALFLSSHAQAHAPFDFGEDGACLAPHRKEEGKADLRGAPARTVNKASRRRFRISLFLLKLEPQKKKQSKQQVLTPPRQRLASASRPARLVVCAGTMSSNDFKVGSTIELDGAPWRIVGEALRRFFLLPFGIATGDDDG